MTAGPVKPSLSFDRAGAKVGAQRIALLEAIAEHGSISAGARAAGMSFRSAWDAVQALNNLFERPLVTASSGGAKGGQAAVTDEGTAVIAAFRRVERDLAAVVGRIEHGLPVGDMLWTLGMKTSARNALRGTVRRLTEGAVTTEVAVDIGSGLEIIASLTRQSAEDLGLAVGRPAIALIKASFVILAKGETAPRTSARNTLPGKVLRRQDGGVTSEVVLEIADGKTLSATVTREAAEELALAEGDAVFALVKAPHVIIAVD